MSETLMNISNPYEGERRPGDCGFSIARRFGADCGWGDSAARSEHLSGVLAPRGSYACGVR